MLVFGAEFGEKVICMSFKSNHSKMFLEHKAITIGYSERISSLPTIFCRNPVRETKAI